MQIIILDVLVGIIFIFQFIMFAYMYKQNKKILTNEDNIEKITKSLFDHDVEQEEELLRFGAAVYHNDKILRSRQKRLERNMYYQNVSSESVSS